MPVFKVRTPADGTTWPAERLAIIKGGSVMIDGEPHRITDATTDGKGGAVLTIDTGKKGPGLAKGAHVDAGIVQ